MQVWEVAESVASKLSADVLALHPVKAFPDKGAKKFLWGGRSAVMGSKPKLQPYIFNGKKYDTVIFGSPVWASNMAPPLRTFIEDNKEALEGITGVPVKESVLYLFGLNDSVAIE